MAGNNRLLLLLEAQSSWTVNILIRILLYLAQSYHEYFERTSQSLYKSTKVKMPKPELYIIYTGNKGKKPDIISLSQEFFDGADIDIEVRVTGEKFCVKLFSINTSFSVKFLMNRESCME
jgi:hypothetical protein